MARGFLLVAWGSFNSFHAGEGDVFGEAPGGACSPTWLPSAHPMPQLGAVLMGAPRDDTWDIWVSFIKRKAGQAGLCAGTKSSSHFALLQFQIMSILQINQNKGGTEALAGTRAWWHQLVHRFQCFFIAGPDFCKAWKKKKITFISCFLLLVFSAMSRSNVQLCRGGSVPILRGDGGFASVHSGWVHPWDALPGGVWACCELCFAGSCSQALHWGQLFTVAPWKGLCCRSRSRPAPLCHCTTGTPTTAEKWDLSYFYLKEVY